MEMLMALIAMLMIIGMASVFYVPKSDLNYLEVPIPAETQREGDSKLFDIEKLVSRFDLDDDAASSLHIAIECYIDWVATYGPITWPQDSTVAIEAGPRYVWPQAESHAEAEYIYNGFEADDDSDPAPYGFALATVPCDEEWHSIFIDTDLWLDCNKCESEESADCDQCEGEGYFSLSIPDLLEET